MNSEQYRTVPPISRAANVDHRNNRVIKLRDLLTNSRYLGIASVLTLAALLRLASIFVLRNFLHPQTWEYGPIVQGLLKGHGFTSAGLPSAYVPPGYSVVLAGFLLLFGERPTSYLLVEVAQAALGVLLVYFVYLLTLTLYGNPATARLAALLAALYPPLIEMCNEFYSPSCYIVLGVGAVLFIVRALQRPLRWDYLIYSAVFMGVLLFFRAEALLLALLFAGLLLLQRQHSRLSRPLLYLAIALTFLLPWSLRNYRIFHAFVPTSTSGGVNLWIGNNPDATGSDRAPAGYVMDHMPQAMWAELQAVPRTSDNEVHLDHILQHAAISYILSHPQRELMLALKKLLMFWTFDPNHEKGRKPIFWVPSILLSLLAAVGLFVGTKPPLLALSPILITIAVTVALGVVFFVLPRYKIGLDPYLCIFAANTMSVLILNRSSPKHLPAVTNTIRQTG